MSVKLHLRDKRTNGRTDKETNTHGNNVHHDRRRHAVSTSLRLVDPLQKTRLCPSVRIVVVVVVVVDLYSASRRAFRLRNDLYCVERGVKLYSLTHAAPLVRRQNDEFSAPI